jgi:prepilin-type N-terminal cleavage/methylation domain-containing protein
MGKITETQSHVLFPERRMNRRQAFTLMELLVVISIIVLLISILQPALGKAKYQTRVTTCMVNIRSQEQAQKQLADDNAGKFWRHNDPSADYARFGGAQNSLWDAIKKGRYLSEFSITICPIIKYYPGGTMGQTPRYLDESWNGSDYAGWGTLQPQILSTYLWFANYQAGDGTNPVGVPTTYLPISGRNEPTWPVNIGQATSDRAFITHRISGGPGGYASHDLGHLGLGLAILPSELLQRTPEQPVGYADGHVVAQPASEIKQRTLIPTGGVGYYYY